MIGTPRRIHAAAALAVALTLTASHAHAGAPAPDAGTLATATSTMQPAVELAAGGDSFSATWPAIAGAQRYQLRYRLATETTWTTVPGFAATTYTRTGLEAGTYTVQVRARVGGVWQRWAGGTVTVSDGSGWVVSADAFRVRVAFEAGDSSRVDQPAVAHVDFSGLLDALGAGGAAFAEDSLRVIEVSAGGATIDPATPFQFDRADGFDPRTNAAGELVVLLAGPTAAATTRWFDVYFDVAGSSHTPVTVTPRVVTVTGVTDEGAASVRFETEVGDWWYDLAGGGFSSLDDIDGNDWISFNAAPGAGGQYRGIPNAVHPAGYFHPGKTVMTTTITRRGPLRATLESHSPGSDYVTRWDVYPTFAEMTMERASGPFWFLYEGTPGGALDPATDTVIRSDGSVIAASGTFNADLAGEEWAAFTDTATARSLFVAQLQDDALGDSYTAMSGTSGRMTVFGFGRAGRPVTLLTRTPERFRVGLVADTTVPAVSSAVRATIRPISSSVASPETRPAT